MANDNRPFSVHCALAVWVAAALRANAKDRCHAMDRFADVCEGARDCLQGALAEAEQTGSARKV